LNIPLLIAGILTAIAALVHGIGGEMSPIRPLIKTDLQQVAKTELRAAWYMVTIHLFASAIMLFLLAVDTNQNLLMGKFLSIQFLGYGLAFLLLAIVTKIKVFQVPQWVLLFLIAGLTFWGVMR
jgi:hypothetical protein